MHICALDSHFNPSLHFDCMGKKFILSDTLVLVLAVPDNTLSPIFFRRILNALYPVEKAKVK